LLEDDSIFEPGRPVILSALTTEIEFFRRQHGRCVVKLQGIDTISEAEKYIGSEIKIPANTLPAAKDGSFYTFQLRGCRVFAGNGEYIGVVADVLGAGGAQVLKVDRENEETLIPFAQSYMRKIDLDQRRIEVDLPEGLRDLNKKA
jgi:16S rRNA processing protein RimM